MNDKLLETVLERIINPFVAQGLGIIMEFWFSHKIVDNLTCKQVDKLKRCFVASSIYQLVYCICYVAAKVIIFLLNKTETQQKSYLFKLWTKYKINF